jgi:inward rectifier potassium channel
MWMLMTYTTAEGAPFRRFEEMKLLRHQSPLFTLSWTIIHQIDESSPLWNVERDALIDQEVAFMVIVEGHDETTGQNVRARKTYYMDDIRFGHRYLDVLDASDQTRTILNYTRFHLTAEE